MFAVIGFVVAKLGVKLLKVGQYLIIILQLSTAQSTIRQRGSMRRSRSPARVQRPFFRPHTPLHRTEDDSSNDDLSSAGSSSGGRSSARARRTMRGRAARPDTILDTTVFAPLYGLEDDGAASPDDSRSSSSRGRSSDTIPDTTGFAPLYGPEDDGAATPDPTLLYGHAGTLFLIAALRRAAPPHLWIAALRAAAFHLEEYPDGADPPLLLISALRDTALQLEVDAVRAHQRRFR